jgi:uncharacterized protein YbjT (DUF2867 family)
MILITGARGLVGRELLRQLTDAGANVRALTRTPETAVFPNGVEVAGGDLGDPASLTDALAGVDRLYLFSSGRAAPGFAAMASSAGVQRIVAVSGFDSDPADTEHPLTEAALDWTHLRPTAFAANALRHWGYGIRAENTVRTPYPDAATAPIHETDVAAVAAAALQDDAHIGQRYELTGPQSLTFREQVKLIADSTGRDITLVEETPEQARQRFLNIGTPELIVDQLLTVWAKLAGRDAAVSPTVNQITGRPARTFGQWASDHATDFG